MEMASNSRRGGGFAPRSSRGRWNGKFQKHEETVPDLEKHPLGELLETMRKEHLDHREPVPDDELCIQDSTYVASYTWLNRDTPTIVVPGQPPKWTPSKTPQKLKEDDDTYYRDPNAAHYPPFPTLAAVSALLARNPTFPTTSVDVFACGNTLGNLVRFARSNSKPFRFRFAVQAIGRTVFLVRKENDPRETIKNVHGYGHTFPEAYTTWDSGAASHQRLIRYRFGGLTCIVRFECDGYIPSSSSTQSHAPPATINDLETAFPSLPPITPAHPSAVLPKPLTTITQHTTSNPPREEPPVPQSAIFDLKTRSRRYEQDMAALHQDMYPTLWLKQIPNFIAAYHDRGSFEPSSIHVTDVTAEVRDWEAQNKDGIRRYAALLRWIVDAATEREGEVLDVFSPGGRAVEIRKAMRKEAEEGALPRDVRERWERGAGDRLQTSDERGVWDASSSPPAGEEEDDVLDFTGCDAEGCGYCGRCSY